MKKLWSGRFNESSAPLLDQFNASLSFDQELYQEDIQGSLVHAQMLAKQNIITQEQFQEIKQGLETIKQEIVEEKFHFDIACEDIHMAIESRLIELIGESGKKLHTARSRNDQVALDFRLYTLKQNLEIESLLLDVIETLLKIAKDHTKTLMPGMTHLQHAQPINLAYHLLTYVNMFKRDISRLNDDYKRNNYCPLGSAALAGTPHPIDRDFTAKTLGFIAPTLHAMDSVSDRDFVLDSHYTLSMIMLHISRFAEELILWSSSEFEFITFSDAYATGSSIMPQKKNPDVAELLRGKSGRVFGHFFGLLTVMKGLPLAYNKDTQEDKEGLFDSIKTLKISLKIFNALLLHTTFHTEKMYKACQKGHLSATDLADLLVKEAQISFREAHHITGQVVAYAQSCHKDITELCIEELQAIDSRIPKNACHVLDLTSSMNARESYGATSTQRTQEQIEFLETWLINQKQAHKKEYSCRN